MNKIQKPINIVRVWSNGDDFNIACVHTKPNVYKLYYYSIITVKGKLPDQEWSMNIDYISIDLLRKLADKGTEVPFHVFYAMADSFGIQILKLGQHKGKQQLEEFGRVMNWQQTTNDTVKVSVTLNPFKIQAEEITDI